MRTLRSNAMKSRRSLRTLCYCQYEFCKSKSFMKARYLLTSLLAAGLWLAGSWVSAQIVFNDNFNDGNDAGWNHVECWRRQARREHSVSPTEPIASRPVRRQILAFLALAVWVVFGTSLWYVISL